MSLFEIFNNDVLYDVFKCFNYGSLMNFNDFKD